MKINRRIFLKGVAVTAVALGIKKEVSVTTVPIGHIQMRSHFQELDRPMLARLTEHIDRNGLIFPISVTQELSLIDGHHRLEAMRRLGWTRVPVLICKSERVTPV